MKMIKMENTIDYKLGQISSDISSLKGMHEEEKSLREENHKKIIEINDRSIRTEDALLRLDSWKNGQTLYMNKTTEDVRKLDSKVEQYKDDVVSLKDDFYKRLAPLETKYEQDAKDSSNSREKERDFKWALIKGLIIGALLLFGFLLITNAGETRDFILSKLK